MKVSVEIEQITVWIQDWRYQVTNPTGYVLPVFFLNTDLPENSQYDRRRLITSTEVMRGTG